MREIKLKNKEEFDNAVLELQRVAEERHVFVELGESLIPSWYRPLYIAVLEYANEHNICLFVGGVLVENRPVVEPEKVKPRKIYIAGPMTGIPDFNRKAFNDMAALLRSRGHIVLNPAILPDGLEQHEYMDITIAMLRCSDTLCLLEGWTGSDGAKAEAALAKKLKIEIEFGYLWRMWA